MLKFPIFQLIAALGVVGRPDDVGHLRIESEQEISKVVKENNKLNIIMNSTIFLDAVAQRLEEIMKNHPSGGIGCNREFQPVIIL